jgi:hypothetical protein
MPGKAKSRKNRSFLEDNREYERWLGQQCKVVKSDLKRKHERMKESAFAFLRATFFRWARQIESICPKLADAPRVLAVGDAHTENFGTWRDRNGRLVWGVNDFDDAASIPYVFDLVRLATSARLAPGLKLDNGRIASAILRGYRAGLKKHRPTLLDDQETWMRPYVACTDQDREDFWTEMDELPVARPPAVVKAGLKKSLSAKAKIEKFAARSKGGGGLGRPRYVAIAKWRGGRIVHEAKAAVPSVWDWVHGGRPARSRFMEVARGRYRSPDPFLDLHDQFIFRRIAADSRKVDLGPRAGTKLHLDLIEAMGFDLGSIHAADGKHASVVERDLRKRPVGWLFEAAESAASAVKKDFKEWKAYRKRQKRSTVSSEQTQSPLTR